MHCFYKLLVNRNQPTLAGQQRHCWRQIDKRKHTRKRFGACVCVSIIVYLMLWNHSDVDVEMMKASRPRWNVESHSDGEQVLGRNHPLQRWAPCLPTFNLFVPGLSWNMRCIEWFKRGRANRYQHVQNELWHLMAICGYIWPFQASRDHGAWFSPLRARLKSPNLRGNKRMLVPGHLF